MAFDRDEVEAAFRTYWQLGAVGEDWDAWCDTCFTEDVTYIEHILGNKQGREAVRAWIKPTMADYGEIYTAYEWHMVDDDGRVVVYMQNRRDNPEPGAPPIDFPGMTVLQYAGNGQFSLEEDFWSLHRGHARRSRSTSTSARSSIPTSGTSAPAATGATVPRGRRARRPTRSRGATREYGDA